MKSLKLFFTFVLTGVLFSSCTTVFQDSFEDGSQNQISLEEVVSGYDLWYIDYHKTSGNGEIAYVSKAFTMSFLNGILYANNNIVDIGKTGNGLGVAIGTYNTFNGLLETNNNLDGINDFEVTVISNNEIRLYNNRQNVNYYLIGYQVDQFDYDKLLYDNIEYFLQEYVAWEKTRTTGGAPNAFDDEKYLAFKPENIRTFYSSKDNFGTQIDSINWSYVGGYEVYDVAGYQDLKILTLNYDGGDTEEFELSVINDGKIRLYNVDSKTTYDLLGRGSVYYLKGEKSKTQAKERVRNSNRKRIKIERKTKIRRSLK